MTPEELLAAAGPRLSAAKYAVEGAPLAQAPSVAGRRKLFRVQWMLTQLKVSVVVAAVEEVSADGWQRFTTDAFQYAKAFRGGLPTGFQSGIGCVAILAAKTVDPAAAALAAERPRVEWFTGVGMPALVDLTTGQVHEYDGRVLVGGIYAKFLRKQRSLITDLVRQES